MEYDRSSGGIRVEFKCAWKRNSRDFEKGMKPPLLEGSLAFFLQNKKSQAEYLIQRRGG